jgi:hypothetical protein
MGGRKRILERWPDSSSSAPSMKKIETEATIAFHVCVGWPSLVRIRYCQDLSKLC